MKNGFALTHVDDLSEGGCVIIPVGASLDNVANEYKDEFPTASQVDLYKLVYVGTYSIDQLPTP